MKTTSHPDKKYGIQMPLINALGSEAKVLESLEVLTQLRDMADRDLQSLFQRILAEPTGIPQWQDQIALLLGEAKRIQKYKELFTIKEK